MKPEKEIKWLVLLYDSKHCKDLLNFKAPKEPACKKDFERLLNAPENNKEFHLWFEKLVNEKVFVFHSMITKNKNNMKFRGYIVDAPTLAKYAKSNPLYKSSWSFFNRDRVI